MMKNIPLTEATVEQMREFAQTVLGISIHPNSKPETAMVKIQEAWDKDTIFLSVPDEPAEQAEATAGDTPQGAAPQPVTADQQAPKPGYVRIKIPQQDKPGGQDPVQVGVNGRAMLIERDKPSDIKYRYYEALMNAEQAIYDPLPDGGISTTPRMVPLYPTQVIAMGERIPGDGLPEEKKAA